MKSVIYEIVMEIKFENGSYIKTIPSQESYKSTSAFRKMSTNEFLRRYGIKLQWYQKIYLFFHDLRNKFDERFCPATYWWRNYRR